MKENKYLLITIDGPAGAGKTTVSKMLAERLGYRYLDTGALYRAVAFGILENRVNFLDDVKLRNHLDTFVLSVIPDNNGFILEWNGTVLSEQIRTPEISITASAVSANPDIRAFLLGLQRNIGKNKALVCEGRDMGTVVFPEADVKFFLDADPLTRALRRHQELSRKNSSVSLEDVSRDMVRRDNNDRNRAVAPLRPAIDAFMIDATEMSPQSVVDKMMEYISSSVSSLSAS